MMFSSPLQWIGVASDLAGQATRLVSEAISHPNHGSDGFAELLGGNSDPIADVRKRWQALLADQGVASKKTDSIRADLRPDGRIDLRMPEEGEPRPGWMAQIETEWNRSADATNLGRDAFSKGLRQLTLP